LRFQANNLGYDDYVGRLAIGRIVSGELVAAGQYTLCRLDGSQVPCKPTRVYGWQGLKRIELERACAGDIVAIAGIEDIHIGETDAFRVLGRGELQLAILIETMRREGFELQASKPAPVVRERAGVLEEPMELLLVDVPEEYVGIVTQLLGVRRAAMTRMEHIG